MNLALLLLIATLTQDSRTSDPLVVKLAPRSPAAKESLRWSPKGAKVALAPCNGGLCGTLTLADDGPLNLLLEKTNGAQHHDALKIDLDRDGKFSTKEVLTCVPKDQRGKWWSSFETELAIAVPADPSPGTRRAYPISLWFVWDPQEPDAAAVLRWSRRGWHEGEIQIGGKPAFALVTDMEMDGIFDQRDAWALARDRSQLLAAPARSLEQHVWLDGIAYRALRVDRHGRELAFEPFSPGFTEEADKARSDPYRADRNAPRAEKPLEFGRDLAKALADAKRGRKRVLIDFETTWCGPCKTMNELVYTAASVVAAAKDVIAVKLDGDEQRAETKARLVEGYPTIILLDADGGEIRRAVGYRGVEEMIKLLKL